MEINKQQEFMEALIKAKQQFQKTGLGGFSSHNKNKYAKLPDIYNAVQEALHDNGIAIIHKRYLSPDLSKTMLITQLMHKNGEFIQDECVVESEKPGNQGHGAAITYSRRYAVMNLCAIAAEEDDDDGQEEQRYIATKKQTPSYITQYQISQIENLIDGDSAIENAMFKAFAIDAWSQLTQDKFNAVISALRKSQV